ncbi:copper chaperone PCu(A)C [Actinomadura latina]|uniref:Copper chaperone PCu(A)C n=1 Tax=Actinomadura latina TaxID=163603 RepID=A0A846ZBQ2_9ACTN|nr:copper chaperone PCu(A)C [Actinomadura latina]NKZ07843.1 copper chaperone PCu(A)C [Actinomadura latina]
MKRPAAALAALILAAGTAACGSDDPDGPRLAVSGAYVKEPPMSDMTAGYVTIANTGTDGDTLTSVTSDLAKHVTVHTTKPNGSMAPAGPLAVPAGGRLVLRTGGYHVMFVGLNRKPKTGETVTFTLRFAASAPITVRAPVRPAGYRPGER